MAQTDEAQFRRLLLDQIAEGVAVVDATGDAFTIVEANRALQRFAADPARPLLGSAWRDAFPQAAERGMLDAFRRVAASGEPHVARDFFVSQVASARAAWQPEALAFWDWR